MVQRIVFLWFILVPFIVSAQSDEHYKLLLGKINFLRTKPQIFLKEVVYPYITHHNLDSLNDKYVASLIQTLKVQKPLKELKFDGYLNRKAQEFAEEMGKTGQTGHYSAKLGGVSKRLERLKDSHYIGENCQYGLSDPLEILMNLLIDQGVPNLGHRTNLLFDKFTLIGIAITSHKSYGTQCVMDFAGPADFK